MNRNVSALRPADRTRRFRGASDSYSNIRGSSLIVATLRPIAYSDYSPAGFDAGDANVYRALGNNLVNRVDPSGLDPYTPGQPHYTNDLPITRKNIAPSAKNEIDKMVDKLDWPARKKEQIRLHLYVLVEKAQFDWYRPNGLFGYCNEWVDEIYPKIQYILPAGMEAATNSITVFHMGWDTSVLSGHEALKIQVADAPRGENSFTFYLDDSYLGGPDHFFVEADLQAKWKGKHKERMKLPLRRDAQLEDMGLKKPIGPGYPGYDACGYVPYGGGP